MGAGIELMRGDVFPVLLCPTLRRRKLTLVFLSSLRFPAFKNGKPSGEGGFKFASGIEQAGTYVAKKEGEEDDEDAPVTITWDGTPVFSTA